MYTLLKLYLFLGMDKKMTRQILFRPGRSVSEVIEEGANVQVKNISVTPNKNKAKAEIVNKQKEPVAIERCKKLYKWLSIHPLINLNGLCKIVGADRANLIKYWKAERELNEVLLNKIIAELKKYGYAE